eukprot:jgi/Galph1/598/GphlegSOOS_G5326.1
MQTNNSLLVSTKYTTLASLSPAVAANSVKTKSQTEPEDATFNNKQAETGEFPMDTTGKVFLKGLTLEQLQSWLESIGERRYRALQIWKWLYKENTYADSFADMKNLSKELRKLLEEKAVVDSLELDTVHEARDGTKKLIFRLKNRGGSIESVLIPNDSWVTLCVSSQLGCAQRCQFCFTAKMGLHAHLSTAEIVDQVVIAKRLYEKGLRISNIVFMGMGEPLHNLENVQKAIDILLNDQGLHLSHNKITVSTSGLVPEMQRFAKISKANLALSLNATTNEVRDQLMPINRKYPLEVVLKAVKDIYSTNRKHEKLFVEYVLMEGINDSLEDAKRLHLLLATIPCKINLIPFNSHEGAMFRSPAESQIKLFADYLNGKGHFVFVRQSRGEDKMAACGQLGKPRKV